MKMSQFLNPNGQVTEQYVELTAKDFKKINDTLIRRGGVITYAANGALGIKTDGDKTLVQTGRGKLNEASALNNVTIADMEDKPTNKGAKTADQLDVGDVVEITGNVQFKGKTGEISKFGKDKKFVVVTLYNYGDHSFHSSDVSELDLSHEEEDEEDMDDDDDVNKFYVAFYDEDEERSWIGLVSKEGGGKWHERAYKGKPEYRWGQSYMSYLKPDDIMSWIHKDYRRGIEIEGPFFNAREAEQHVKSNWGTLEESVEIHEGYETVLESIEVLEDDDSKRKLYDILKDVGDRLAKSGFIGPDGKKKIKKLVLALLPYTKDKKKFSNVLSKWLAEEPDATDLYLDEVFSEVGIRDIDEFYHQFFGVSEDTKVRVFENYQQWKAAAGADGLRVFNSSPVVALNEGLTEVHGKWTGETGWLKLQSPVVKEDMMARLDRIAASYGTEFYLLEVSIAAELVDFKKANELAPAYGKNKFWTLNRESMARLVNENPSVVIGLTEGHGDNPTKAELEAYRLHALKTLGELHNIIHHIAEEELISCKVHRIAPIGSVINSKKFTANSDIDVAFYADCNDKPRKPGLQEDLSEKLQERFVRHPFKDIGVINTLVFHEDINEPVKEAHESWDDVEKWKTAVKNAYPDVAKKLVFKAKIEAGVSTISAEVPGEDRSYGVWDMDEKKGYVLSESKDS